jgi:hypothetical protein
VAEAAPEPAVAVEAAPSRLSAEAAPAIGMLSADGPHAPHL